MTKLSRLSLTILSSMHDINFKQEERERERERERGRESYIIVAFLTWLFCLVYTCIQNEERFTFIDGDIEKMTSA